MPWPPGQVTPPLPTPRTHCQQNTLPPPTGQKSACGPPPPPRIISGTALMWLPAAVCDVIELPCIIIWIPKQGKHVSTEGFVVRRAAITFLKSILGQWEWSLSSNGKVWDQQHSVSAFHISRLYIVQPLSYDFALAMSHVRRAAAAPSGVNQVGPWWRQFTWRGETVRYCRRLRLRS